MMPKTDARCSAVRLTSRHAASVSLFAMSVLAAPVLAVASPAWPAVRDELLMRASIDQSLRQAMTLSTFVQSDSVEWARIRVVDAGNTAWLKTIVARHGWPGRSRVGEAAAQAAWLLVQHADHDPAFQRRCLELIERLPEDEVSGKARAYLTDRVRLAEGKRQVFGSQLIGDCSKGFVPQPIEDERHVDERRTRFGLQSLSDYLNAAPSVLCPTEDKT